MFINKIKIAIVGIGNCASSLIQGIEYYKGKNEKDAIGLMHWDIGGYLPFDIEVVLAYDIDSRKVGSSLSRAIFAEPNCTKKIWNEYLFENQVNDVKVKMGRILDGFSLHLIDYDEKYRIVVSDKLQPEKEDIIRDLKESKCEIIISYLPVGSQMATEFWAHIALDSGCGFINAMPIFIASNEDWENTFKNKGLPIIGDDVKSQVGATIVNRALVQMLLDRGAKIDNSWQLNVGGNTDFLNMVSQERLKSKKISKTESISSLIEDGNSYVYAGPNGYIECLKDNKISHLKLDFRIFGDVPCNIDLKLSVEDSPNSAGIVIDAIRCVKLALDRGIGGAILPACAYFMKHPPQQMRDEDARTLLEDFIRGFY